MSDAELNGLCQRAEDAAGRWAPDGWLDYLEAYDAALMETRDFHTPDSRAEWLVKKLDAFDDIQAKREAWERSILGPIDAALREWDDRLGVRMVPEVEGEDA